MSIPPKAPVITAKSERHSSLSPVQIMDIAHAREASLSRLLMAYISSATPVSLFRAPDARHGRPGGHRCESAEAAHVETVRLVRSARGGGRAERFVGSHCRRRAGAARGRRR